ncbi:beta strand repeat-containing protein [Psychrobacter fjordensis]|uniref:beta strand repeat-containing protein n=1 Tax=Psychrobacter fjordensis TaxID=664424 RepID=UPI00191A4140|nr:Ig-like domain-containing protein [Psychrobacter fjordensis]
MVNATDGDLDSAPTTGTAPGIVNEVNAAPTAPSVSDSANFELGQAAAGDAVATASGSTDPDGDAVTYELDADSAVNYAIDPATGEITLTQAGADTVNAGGTLAAPVVNATDGDLDSAPTTGTAPGILPDTTAPDAPTDAPVVTDNVANDGSGDVLDPVETIADGGVTNDNTPSVIVPVDQVANGTPQLVIDGEVVASDAVTNDDGSVTLTPTTPLTDGEHELSYNIIDAANNESDDAPAVSVTVDTTVIIAQDDTDDLDLGEVKVTNYPSVTDDSVTVLGITEGNGITGRSSIVQSNSIVARAVNADGIVGFTVSEGASGTVSIDIQQVALVAVADAVNIEVYNSNGDLVYVGTTGGNPLVGDLIGLDILGVTGNDTLTATVSGLEPDNYTVVVRNDRSALETLVNDLTLAELGDAGVVLGPDNQDAVLSAVETSLNTSSPILLLGSTVRGILESALELTGELSVDELIAVLQENALVGGLLAGVLDPVLDAVAEALLSNTLTLLESTDVTTTLTEYSFDSNVVITGNVINPDGSVADELGEDIITANTKLTDINSDNTLLEPTSEILEGLNVFTIQGQYGILIINELGGYIYTANGDYASSGKTEVFEYTISNGAAGNSDTAKLVINISSTAPEAPATAAIITDNVVNDGSGGVLTPSEVIADDGTTNDNTPSLEIAAGVLSDGETLQLVINGIVVDAVITENADGSYTLTPQTPLDDAEYELSYNIKDAVNNVSGNAPAVTVTVDTTSPVAVDDQNLAELEVTSTVSTSTAGLNGDVNSLLGIGVLSGLVDVDLLEENNVFEVSVEAGNTQVITLDGSGGQLLSLSAVLGGNNNFDLEIYRQEDGSDLAELVQLKEDFLEYSPGIAGLLGGWSADALTLDTFTGGAKGAKYFIVATNPAANDGLLNLGALASISIGATASTLTDYTVTGDSVLGNVIDNDDGIGQSITVTAVNGDPINGSTTIDGDYGTLVIGSNGDYTYTPFKNNSVIGQTDDFDYTINDGNGNTDTAALSIAINSDGASAGRVSASSFTLADDATSIDIPDTSLTVSSEGLDVLSFDSEDQTISLSDIFEVDVIDLSGIGANTLTVQAADITTSDPIYIKGDSDDTVDLGNIGTDLSDTDRSGNTATWVNTQTTASDADGQQYNVWALSTDSATQVNIDVDITNVI